MSARRLPLTRFLSRVSVTSACWLWGGSIDPYGYGRFWADGRNIKAHRWSYQWFIGCIPVDLQLDHLCRVRHCVNPDHLEPVTLRENTARGFGRGLSNSRKTHCPRGHPYDAVNTRVYQGKRYCYACRLKL